MAGRGRERYHRRAEGEADACSHPCLRRARGGVHGHTGVTEPSEHWKSCTGKPDVPWEQQIKACTAIIAAKTETPERLAVAYNNRAVARLEMVAGGIVLPDKQAMVDLEAAIKLNPKYADAYYNRGRVWFEAGVYGNAADLFTAAIELDPKHAGAYNQRGITWIMLGDADRALDDFNTAIKLGLKSADLYYGRGIAWHVKEDVERAIADYGEAIRLDRNFFPAYRDRAQALLERNEFKRAIADLTELLRLQPNDNTHLANRGYAYFFLGDYPAAVADLDRMIKIDPHDTFSSTHAFFRYLARLRTKQDGRAELAAHTSRAYGSDRLYDLYLGKGTPEAALESPPGTIDRCRQEFHVGAWYLISGNRDSARRHFQAASDAECRQAQPHQRAAAVELTRMGP